MAGVVFFGLLAVHAVLLVFGAFDDHKRFGFRPFNESDTWSAEIVRVTATGERLAIDDGTWEYHWNDLMDGTVLRNPWRTRHADGGARSTVDLIDRALDWVIDNTPNDPQTVRLEATVVVVHNAGAPEVIELVGADRPESP